MQLGEVCCATVHLVSPTSSPSFPISSFFQFWSNFHAAFWRPYLVLLSSNLVFRERFGCIVSIGSDLIWFGVTVVKISCLKEKWRSIGNFATLILENSFLSIRGKYCRPLFMECSWDIIIQSCLGKLLQLLPSWYNFLHKKRPKNSSFWLENSETFNQSFGIILISHPFELWFLPINYRFKGEKI